MPKETFYNLPEEKKQKLIEALQREFSSYSLAKASIARIINDASIPRGSFYQYFEDKEDAFFYLFDKQTKVIADNFFQFLQSSKGDIFQATTNLFQLILEEHNPYTIFRRALLNMDDRIYQSLSIIFVNKKDSEHFNRTYHALDLTLLNIENKEQFIDLMNILAAITFHCIRDKYLNDIPLETAMKHHKSKLNLVKKGVATLEHLDEKSMLTP